MEALVETTGGAFHAHTYLLDGTKLVAYVKVNETVPFYFKNPIKGFDRRGRKFEPGNKNLFTTKKDANARTIIGSSGQTYTVTEESCTCPGFTYRGTCKHMAEHVWLLEGIRMIKLEGLSKQDVQICTLLWNCDSIEAVERMVSAMPEAYKQRAEVMRELMIAAQLDTVEDVDANVQALLHSISTR